MSSPALLGSGTHDASRAATPAAVDLLDGMSQAEADEFIEATMPATTPANADDGNALLIEGEDRTQSGNADRLAAGYGDCFRYVAKWNQFLVWRDHYWQRDDRNVEMAEMAKDIGRQWLVAAASAGSARERESMISWARSSLSLNHIKGTIELSRGIPGIAVDYNLLDANPWLFGVANGVIDLRTGNRRDGFPGDLMTMQSPVAYDRNAGAPRWEKALKEWFPDEEVRAYVQRLAGSALVGVQRDHVFVIHYGGGRNGKGTFVRALQNVFGPYAVTPHLSLLVNQRHTEHDTIKADLFRARLAVASETEKRVSLAESSVKNLTGADRISCRRLYENTWQFRPSHSLWLQTNHLPEIRGRDLGVWSRVRVVKWIATFFANPDVTLDETLAGEAAGILNWLVEGCLMWQRAGLAEPEAVIRPTLAYRRAEDVLSRFAQENGIVFENQLSLSVAVMNEIFDKWAISEGVKLSRKEFGEWLLDNGAWKDRKYSDDGTRLRFWAGVGLDSSQAGSSDAE